MTDFKGKRKKEKEYDQTRSVFYITWDATMQKYTDLKQTSAIGKQSLVYCFNKNEIRIILKLFLTLTARKNFAYVPQFRKQKPSLVS